MRLDVESRRYVKTIGDFADAARRLGSARLRVSVAPFFLVCRPSTALHAPDGPQATLRVDLRVIAAAREGRFVESCPAWPVRRKTDSVYSFVSVGRTGNCDVVIPDESISKLHAVLREQGPELLVHDAGSRNKTYVGEQEAPRRGEGKPLAARPGAELRFAGVELVLFNAEGFCELIDEVVGPDL